MSDFAPVWCCPGGSILAYAVMVVNLCCPLLSQFEYTLSRVAYTTRYDDDAAITGIGPCFPALPAVVARSMWRHIASVGCVRASAELLGHTEELISLVAAAA